MASSAVHQTMQDGLRRLLDHHPLLGGLVSRWRVYSERVGTMAVAWERERISLIYDPAFVQRLSVQQLEAVLMHEARHVIYGHCFMDPTEWPHEQALLIAQEVTVNEGLADLPVNPIVLADYPVLKSDTDTEERYAILADWLPPDEDLPGLPTEKPSPKHEPGGPLPSTEPEPDPSSDPSSAEGQPGSGSGSGAQKAPETESKSERKPGADRDPVDQDEAPSDATGDDPSEADGAEHRQLSCAASAPSNETPSGATGDDPSEADNADQQPTTSAPAHSSRDTPDPAPLDNHDQWDGMRENREQVEAELWNEISDIVDSKRNIGVDADDLQRTVDSLRARQPGWNPGTATVDICERTRDISPIQLRQLLERMSGSGRDRGARFDRPPRRAPELLGIVPAQSRMRNRVIALAVIDTSGSMDDATLASIASILKRIEDAAELTVVECDTAIHRVYPFNGSVRTVTGRGGTDFSPPLAGEFLSRMGAEAVIYFTDGFGRVPANSPRIPVIWALTHGGKPPCNWGKVLKVEE